MDKQLCKLYRESSRNFAQNIDVTTKQNIELLANLAVMELQFMHCCALNSRERASSGEEADSQILPAGDNDDDDIVAGGEEGSGGGSQDEGDANDESEVFDWTTIDVNDILGTVSWEKLDCRSLP